MMTFLLLPLYTSVLDAKEYGIVDLLNTFMSLLLPIIGLQIEKGVFRELLEARKIQEDKCKIITNGLFVVVTQCIISVPVFVVISPFIHNNYLFFLLANVLAYVFVSFMQQVARGLNKINEYALGSFINAIGTIVFNVLFLVIFKLGVYGMLLGTFFGFLVALIYYVWTLHLSSYIRIGTFNKATLKILFRYSLPLIPNALAWWVFSASDRVIVSSILGLDANGILAISLKFSTIIITVYNIFHASWIESVSLAIKDADISVFFNHITNIALKLFTSLSLIIITIMPFMFPILIDSNFSSAYPLIPIAIIATILNVLQGLISAIYTAKYNTKSIAYTSLVAAIINIIIHLALIKFIGLYASVVSTLVAFFVLTAHRIIDVNKTYFRVQLDKKFISLALATTAFVLATYYTDNSYDNILSIIVVAMFTMMANKESYSFIKRVIVKKLRKDRPYDN